MGDDWSRAVAAVEAAVRGPSTMVAVSRALTDLGEVLARTMPRADDDTNELPDDVPPQAAG
jgi:uncharacterized membrane protein